MRRADICCKVHLSMSALLTPTHVNTMHPLLLCVIVSISTSLIGGLTFYFVSYATYSLTGFCFRVSHPFVLITANECACLYLHENINILVWVYFTTTDCVILWRSHFSSQNSHKNRVTLSSLFANLSTENTRYVENETIQLYHLELK